MKPVLLTTHTRDGQLIQSILITNRKRLTEIAAEKERFGYQYGKTLNVWQACKVNADGSVVVK